MSKREPRNEFSVTFEICEGGKVTSRATFTGSEWDRVYRWYCRMTPEAWQRIVEGQRIERVSLEELGQIAAQEPGVLAFPDIEQLNEYLGSQQIQPGQRTGGKRSGE